VASLHLQLSEINRLETHLLSRAGKTITEVSHLYPVQTVVYFLFSLFTRLAGEAEINDISSDSSGMGGKEISLHLVHGEYFLKMRYVQELNDSWQSVGVEVFEQSSSLPRGISLSWDLDMVNGTYMNIDIDGMDESEASDAHALMQKCFENVKAK
jgi:hypothetical protein